MPTSPMPPLSVAPMMDWTDRHCRYFLRQISRHVLLYTEMVTTGAILHGDRARHLDFDAAEHPLVLQLGGDDPRALAECARIAQDWGYDEVNLNVGCPSSRVQRGAFGVCLMRRPEVVAAAVEAMQAAVDIPVTVKHRIGVDDDDSYEFMLRFVDIVAAAGCTRFTVHARKAWLQGLSPKQNRNIPPLRYEEIYRLKAERPQLAIEINGGLTDWQTIAAQFPKVDAVMIGRAAYRTPWLLHEADQRLFGAEAPPTADRAAVVAAVMPYLERLVGEGHPPHRLTRHMLDLFAGVRGARAWRRHLSTRANRPGAGAEVLTEALALVEQAGGLELAS